MNSFLFLSGAAWAVYLCVAFFPFLFSLAKSGDRWFTAAFLCLSFWALSGGFLYGGYGGGYADGSIGAATGLGATGFFHLQLWYGVGSAGLAGFLWANLHYTFRLCGVTVRPLTVFLLLSPPVAAAFLPFFLENFGAGVDVGFADGAVIVEYGSGFYPFSVVFRVVQAVVLILYTAVPAALILRVGTRGLFAVGKRTAGFLAATLVLIPLLFAFVPAFFEKNELPDPAAFFSIPYALMLTAGAARYRSLYLLPLRLGGSILHVLEVPAAMVDRQGLVFQGNSLFHRTFGPDDRRLLREIAGRSVSSLAAEVLGEPSRSGERVAVTPGGVFRVTISAVKGDGKSDGNEGAAGLFLVFRPIEHIDSFREQKGLTARETEVAQLLAGGYSVKGAADALCVSETTIRTHRDHIYQKCAVKTRADLANLLANLAGAAHEAVDAGARGATDADAVRKTAT